MQIRDKAGGAEPADNHEQRAAGGAVSADAVVAEEQGAQLACAKHLVGTLGRLRAVAEGDLGRKAADGPEEGRVVVRELADDVGRESDGAHGEDAGAKGVLFELGEGRVRGARVELLVGHHVAVQLKGEILGKGLKVVKVDGALPLVRDLSRPPEGGPLGK